MTLFSVTLSTTQGGTTVRTFQSLRAARKWASEARRYPNAQVAIYRGQAGSERIE